VIFTYVHRQVLTEPEAFPGARRVLRTTAKLGEPWTFGLDPAEVGAYLATRGLTLASDTGATEYRARYLAGRADARHGYEFYRVALARVARER
jgi:O-methyltransferase involved in polyketide biosynthesis